jgi:hypothetical protein
MLIALACGALLAGLVSCGGDDESADKTVPTIATETEAPTTAETATAPGPTPTATAPVEPPRTTPPADTDSGGTTVPQTKTDRQPQDGPYNDTPPEAGSPAERFEQECERNPEICGN